MTRPRRIIVGITGASGALYAQRTIQCLLEANVEVHLVVSPLGIRLLHDELGMEKLDLDALTGLPPGEAQSRIKVHHYRDVGAPIASGSFLHQGMVIVPCSANTLAAVATGMQQNLLHRAAGVTLKERRKLVVVHREMPLGLNDIRNMERATEAGAIICPANPGFYLLPRTVQDLVDFVAGKIMDLLEIDHSLDTRWESRVPGFGTTPAAAGGKPAGDDGAQAC